MFITQNFLKQHINETNKILVIMLKDVHLGDPFYLYMYNLLFI